MEDAAELMRLRGLMHEAMGTPAHDPVWRVRCTDAFARRLATDEFVAFVVPGEGRLVSCGCEG